MKIEVLGNWRDENDLPELEVIIGEGATARTVHVPLGLSEEQLQHQMSEPVALNLGPGFWIYRNYIVRATEIGSVTDEILLRVKHRVLAEERSLEKLRREVEAFERFEKSTGTPRIPIPDDVRLFVWQRDGGRCVKCGSNELLEYDHIIPLVKGSSNTDRNIQLLCENCNRNKGASIA